MSNIYVVIYTDLGDTTDGLARVTGAFKDKETAMKEMQSDVAYYLNVNEMYSITECDDKHTLVGNEEGGCLWQIVTVAEVK